VTFTVLPVYAERATRLAEVMTRDRVATGAEDIAWDAEEVLRVALARGLADLEQTYLSGDP
jgi:hypothetical protein